jgi:hypothetical protein
MSRNLAVYLAAVAALFTLATSGGVLLYREAGPSDSVEALATENAYNVTTWELRHLPAKWLYKAGRLFKGAPAADDEILRRYFMAAGQILALEREDPQSPRLEELRAERAALENHVESIIEGRVTHVLKTEGLVLNPPPFTRLGIVFPPVDFELDPSPRVLAVSPRSEIYLDRNYLLRPGLSINDVTEIERAAETSGADIHESGISALVVNTGGVATYPSVVSELVPYERLIDTVFHEWIHQYLVFFPLGRGYFSGPETRTLNESVANIAGRELAKLYFQDYGPLWPPGPPGEEPAENGDGPAFDFTAEMRDLRRGVESLLAQGRIDEAEELMNRKRDEFEAQGYYIRRLNQAYFAFYGFYADTGASIDPIGPRLQRLFEIAGSPGEFVRLAAGITSRGELEKLLETLPD